MATKKKVVKKPSVSKIQTSKFYHFSQNNSGGAFVYDKEKGISVNVIVEADSANDANAKAERIGLYFDGDGDCSCCGNRWHEAGQITSDGERVPSVYGEEVKPGAAIPDGYSRWTSDERYEGFIHYKDGSIAFFW